MLGKSERRRIHGLILATLLHSGGPLLMVFLAERPTPTTRQVSSGGPPPQVLRDPGQPRRQPVRKVPSRDGYPRGSSRVVERWREMRARQHSASGITDRVSIIHDRVCSFGNQVVPQYISVWRGHRSFVKGIGELRL